MQEEADGRKGMSKSVLLCRTTDPEVKRNIIGDTFMTVANRVIAEMNLDPVKVSQGADLWNKKTVEKETRVR